MAREAGDLAESLAAATDSGFRGRLLARGQAQSMIRRAGILPQDAPQFSPFLDADLLNYGYAMLSTSLDLLEAAEGDDDMSAQITLAREGFIQSSYALEAATRNAAPAEDLAFHGLIAGAASHLGGYAARAFSLMQASRRSGRLTPMEQTLADLAMRDLSSIEQRTRSLRSSPQVSDEVLLAALIAEDDSADESSPPGEVGPVVLLLSENYLTAVSAALFAIEIGSRELLVGALEELQLGEQASLDMSAPGPWWVYRLTRRLLGDLFDTSIETNLPSEPPPGAGDRVDAVALSPPHLCRVALGTGPFRDRPMAFPAPCRRPDLPGRTGSRCRAADQRREDPHRRVVDLGVPCAEQTYGLRHPAASPVRPDRAGPRTDLLAARHPRLVPLRQHGGQRRRRGHAALQRNRRGDTGEAGLRASI